MELVSSQEFQSQVMPRLKYSYSYSSSAQVRSSGSETDESSSESGFSSPMMACTACQRHHGQNFKCQSPQNALFEPLRLGSHKAKGLDTQTISPYPKSPLPDLAPAKIATVKVPTAALYEAAVSNQATVCAIFGGQGNDEEYFAELRSVHEKHHAVVGDFVLNAADLFHEIARDERFVAQYPQGFDLAAWLEDESAQPETAYLISAPISMPLIGLLQLLHYRALGHDLGCSPADMHAMLSGTTGHSQGIISSAVIASAKTWTDFEQKAIDGLFVLQSIGARAHEVFPPTALPPSVAADAQENGEGLPTPMLSIRDLPLESVRKAVAEANVHLGDSQIEVALVNGRRRVVVSGPPTSLHSLNVKLRSRKAKAGLNQAKIPFSQRKPVFQQRFLPTSAPFHSSHLAKAVELVAQDIAHVQMMASDLQIPVYSTADGHDLRTKGNQNIATHLADLILVQPLDWELASKFSGATTIVDFGPGGIGGVGALTSINKEGSGARVVLGSADEGSNTELGYRPSIIGNELPLESFVRSSWLESFGPQLVRTVPNRTLVDTKFSRLLGLPPVMVAGMTPTTSSTDFVIAVMNAGYHVELAAGGFHNAEALTTAVKQIANNVGPARGITINVIYATPHILRWQIPAIAKLRADGYPIEGLTIGAGVPSPEIVGEYIRDLGLRHVSLKPGSTGAIQQVIAIAKAHPTFPVILQWTGGRGGGHHSYEDFEQPLLEMYGRIRECNNISLVVGSGLGSAEDSYPYISGAWSTELGYPAMPCDGILLGSRVMVAKEASTSTSAKQAIVDAAGVDNKQWEQTYKCPTGGVLTVKSEMGEPIHKLATRLVRFWYEMDHTVFNLKKADMVKQLQTRRSYIIEKLNADCHKVWFGKDSTGEAVEIDEMTYEELVNRLVELTFVSHQNRWIHKSFRTLAEDVMSMAQSRFCKAASRVTIAADPRTAASQLISSFPAMADELVTYNDSRKFVEMCKRKGQKPVPFVPVLDENFETWFKKDSLWQSEDIDAVVGQDVGRVCILHGPVAAKHSTIVDEPVKNIMDGIHLAHVQKLSNKLHNGKEANAPFVECFGIEQFDAERALEPNQTSVAGSEKLSTYDFGDVDAESLPSLNDMLNTLGGTQNNWRRAFFTAENIMQGSQLYANPAKRLFQPTANTSVLVRDLGDSAASIALFEHVSGVANKVAEVKSIGDGVIDLQVLDHHIDAAEPAILHLRFAYQPESLLAPLREVMEGRNDRIKDFYQQIWFKGESALGRRSVTDEFVSGPVNVSSNDVVAFSRCIGNLNDAFTKRGDRTIFAPMDYAIVLGWKAIMMPLFAGDLDCDLLKLVHLSNGFEMLDNAAPIREGDVVSASTRVTAIVNQESGKRVRVEGHLLRDGAPVMKLASEFFVRGSYTDNSAAFETVEEPLMEIDLATVKDVAVLASKKWFQPCDKSLQLLKSKLVFHVESTSHFDAAGQVCGITAVGRAELIKTGSKPQTVARINFADATASKNPVHEYLQRHGAAADQSQPLPHAVPVLKEDGLLVHAPACNQTYAQVSGDHNPIHVNATLARYAELPGTITHGMHTSAIVRGLVEQWVCETEIGLFREFRANFTGMVLPGDALEVSFEHTGMRRGQKIFAVKAVNVATQQTVLQGDAVIEPPSTAYVFTGQGSQRQGMGMDLYAESAAARKVWDFADAYFQETYGFSIIDIVKNNPKEHTVHFGGKRGRAIRANYMRLSLQTQDDSGVLVTKQLFPTITEDADSYTFMHAEGLLFATQFTQPALTIMEKAIFADLEARGLVSSTASFAGHSLGEYAALCALGGGALTLASLIDLTFYRGMSMQVTVQRDAAGRSHYAMCAVDPGRAGAGFDQARLRQVVAAVSQATGKLLEIVNYNIRDMQYVCAGDIAAISCMTHVLDSIKAARTNVATVADLDALVLGLVAEWQATKAPRDGARAVLKRGAATIPLQGIDVPFHSSFLMPGVDSYRHVLQHFIKSGSVDPTVLSGKYIPNLTATPFEVSRAYVERVHATTGSHVLSGVLDKWTDIAQPTSGFDALMSTAVLAH